jgi:hypothetical protein
MPGPGKVSRRKEILKRMAEQVSREAIAAIEGEVSAGDEGGTDG